MDYISRYGLKYNPFIKNTRNTTVETSEYHEITFRLNLLLQTRGFGLLTGSPGRGKTTMVRNWSESLNDAAYKIIYVSLSTITVQDFYIQLVASLGQEPCYKKSKNFRLIQSGIERLNVEKKMTPVIVLDEANYLSNSVLNDLKIIFNFDMDSRDKAVVLLVGLPELRNQLALTIHEPLRQRITMNYNIDALSKEEAAKYVREKMSMAGCHQEVFERSALEAILNAAGGTPRMIDKYVNASLLLGSTLNKNIIDAETVLTAIDDATISIV